MRSLFDERHEQFRSRVREVTRAWDQSSVQRWESDGHLPPEVFQAFGDAGIFRERWEEGEAGLLHGLVLAEETSHVCASLFAGVSMHCELFTRTLRRLARGPRQLELLEDCLAGRAIGCFGITEPHGGSDIGGVRCAAAAAGDGWHLTGEKRFTTNGGRATHAMVLVRTREGDATRSLSLMAVPLRAPGVTVVGFIPTVGWRGVDTSHLRFDARLDGDAIVGVEGAGLPNAQRALVHERLVVCFQTLVLARASLGLATAYARRRIVSARPLVEMQVVRHRLADATTALWAAEAFLESTVRDALDGRQVGRRVAALKLHCASVAGRIVDDCIQVLGGRGYTANYPLEGYWRDLRLGRIGGGSDEVMRELVASPLNKPQPEYDRWAERLDAADVAWLENPNAEGRVRPDLRSS